MKTSARLEALNMKGLDSSEALGLDTKKSKQGFYLRSSIFAKKPCELKDSNEVRYEPKIRLSLSSGVTYAALLMCFLLTVHSVEFLSRSVLDSSEYDINTKSITEAATLVWCSGWITAVSTGFGAFPFYFFNEINQSWIGFSNAVAAGMMLSASLGLIYEATQHRSHEISMLDPPTMVLIGILFGIGFIKSTQTFFGNDPHEELLELKKLDTKKVCLIMAVMTLHSFSEGVAIGVSYHSQSLGSFVTTTLAIHNIPEGLALSIVLIPRGFSKLSTTLWCIVSSFPQPIMAVPAYIFVDTFKLIVPIGLGFAAGAMLYVAIFELYDDAQKALPSCKATGIMIAAGMVMTLLQALVNS